MTRAVRAVSWQVFRQILLSPSLGDASRLVKMQPVADFGLLHGMGHLACSGPASVKVGPGMFHCACSAALGKRGVIAKKACLHTSAATARSLR